MEAKEIKVVWADTGHWLARCDHEKGVIELNKRDFMRLSPMMRDYIWIHEYVHLTHNVTDEAECNQLTDSIFISRAKNAIDRQRRIEFINKSQ